MPTPSIILAEDFSGLWIFFLLMCLVPIVGAVLGVAFARTWPKISLACGILSVLLGIGVLMTLYHADAPPGVWAIASVPLLCGLGCVARWYSIRNNN